jgi:hypothetical protein
MYQVNNGSECFEFLGSNKVRVIFERRQASQGGIHIFGGDDTTVFQNSILIFVVGQDMFGFCLKQSATFSFFSCLAHGKCSEAIVWFQV